MPHYGSKTIEVKLTVSPEQQKQVDSTVSPKDNDANGKSRDDNSSPPKIRYKRDLNVTIRQGGATNNDKRRHCRRQVTSRRAKKHQCCNINMQEEQPEEKPDVFISDESSDGSSRISGNLTSDEGQSDNEEITPKKQQDKMCYDSKSRYTIPNLFIKDMNLCNGKNCVGGKTTKKRSGSLQRQELLEIIQANMDKNNLSFQTPR